MNKRLASLREQLVIDKHHLDEELIQQPERFMSVAEEAARLTSIREQQKEACRRVEAEVSSELRVTIEEKSGKKPTEAQLQAEILMDKRYKNAREEYLLACEDETRTLALKEAYQQRSYVLKDLTALWIAGYFADRSVSGGNATALQQEQVEERRAAITAKRNARAALREE